MRWAKKGVRGFPRSCVTPLTLYLAICITQYNSCANYRKSQLASTIILV